jgi:hypothetical protein
VETGTFAELLERNGAFVDIFRDQLVRDVPGAVGSVPGVERA